MNNLNSADLLAVEVLKDTDWQVEKQEVLVEKVKDHLVYVRLGKKFEGITRLKDQTDLSKGVEPYDNLIELPENTIILAFYSCCKNKPTRF
jgi:hypothetical protein